jgi:hypothetical protein
MKTDRELQLHRDWINALQPTGLVVSPPALAHAGAWPDKNILAQQQALLELLPPPEERAKGRQHVVLRDFTGFATDVLGWSPSKLAGASGGPPLPDALKHHLVDYHETLRPTFAVPAVRSANAAADDGRDWLMLIEELPVGTPLDEKGDEVAGRWPVSPQTRIETLLKELEIPIGLLFNGLEIRLVYAPRGESSGYMTWPLYALAEVGGRTLLSALVMLLGKERLFTLERSQRLGALLVESRKYQTVVSTKLAGQVLEALNELLRGLQSANQRSAYKLLGVLPREQPEHIYGGLLAVLLRLVFVLYAEERGLLSGHDVFVRNYSLVGLFGKLREDAGRFPDTMDQRFGAWSRLLVLFRLIHDGAKHGELTLPARHGHLFDPDGWAFLEGRTVGRVMGKRVGVPAISDGVVFRVLEKLLVLDGDRLSYRTLDVEQIGSVYENMMGFEVKEAAEPSIGLGKKHIVIGLETLLEKKGDERKKYLKEQAEVELADGGAKLLKAAKNIDEIVAALGRRISPLFIDGGSRTPRVVPKEGLYLQPTDERRRSGSHYTPRELTEPIVRTTLRPVFEALGPKPTEAQILDLKICDPAMGSGAFLVEACRQLGAKLVESWNLHGRRREIPPDEDVQLFAQRLVAERCLYGVDKNPFAVDLGKLSLWLATLAKNHPFTFLDHSVRNGDSLLGLTLDQLLRFDWLPGPGMKALPQYVKEALARATIARRKLLALAGLDDERTKAELLDEAEHAVADVRLVGDAVLASYFEAKKPKDRRDKLKENAGHVMRWLAGEAVVRATVADTVRQQREDPEWRPFHWPVEFPEVLGEAGAGFDGIVGNPPYLGGTKIGGHLGLAYHDYLVDAFTPATGLADLIAFFVRRAHDLLRDGGALGFVTTNTVAQGDTRRTGLEAVLHAGASIYEARTRYRWPGGAAVVASVFHILRGRSQPSALLDGRTVDRISAFLLRGTVDETPAALAENAGHCFLGTKIWGAGFVFEEEPSKGSSSLNDMERLLVQEPANREVIFPYLGGEEFNDSPTQTYSRFVIDFGDMSASSAGRWPALFSLVQERVRPVRATNKQRNYRENWWLHANRVEQAAPFLAKHGRLLALTSVSKHLSAAFVERGTVVANSMVLLLVHEFADFAAIQSRVHEVWARLIGSSMKDDLRYTTACFDTFPQPASTDRPALERVGSEYYGFRAELMKRTEQGLTKTYNDFHDPDEMGVDIVKLRDLHGTMDRAVLEAYGWVDIEPTATFRPEFEDDEDDEGRRKKKAWRYAWSDETRDEVLARLLELNASRPKKDGPASPDTSNGEEPLEDENPQPTTPKKSHRPRKSPKGQTSLF